MNLTDQAVLELYDEISRLKKKIANQSEIINRYRKKAGIHQPPSGLEMISQRKIHRKIDGQKRIIYQQQYRLPIEPQPQLLLNAEEYIVENNLADKEVELWFDSRRNIGGWMVLIEVENHREL